MQGVGRTRRMAGVRDGVSVESGANRETLSHFSAHVPLASFADEAHGRRGDRVPIAAGTRLGLRRGGLRETLTRRGMSFALRTIAMSTDSVVRLDSIGAEVRIGVHLDVSGRRQGSPDEQTPHSSQVIAGRYELVRVIGQGSMGAVWLANHRGLDEQVAVKLLSQAADTTSLDDVATIEARFRFEAQVAARLSRKTRHIVRVTDYGQEGERPYLVMELLEGETLETRLAKRGPMATGDVSKIVTQIARGLAVAHAEGVLHRDLKPANIFLVKGEDGDLLVKLLDFGVARRGAPLGLATPFATARGVVVGTPGYMSPEQADGSPALDARADVWSLAAIAYEALTGEIPVDGTNVEEMLANLRAGRIVPLRERRPELPLNLERFFERAFAPRIANRHASSSELALAFEDAVGVLPTAAAETGTPRTLRLPWRAAAVVPPVRRQRYARSVIGLIAAAFVTAALLFGSWHASAERSTASAATKVGGTIEAAGLGTATRSSLVDPGPIADSPTAPSAPTDERPTTASRPRTPTAKASRAQPYDYGEFSTYF